MLLAPATDQDTLYRAYCTRPDGSWRIFTGFSFSPSACVGELLAIGERPASIQLETWRLQGHQPATQPPV